MKSQKNIEKIAKQFEVETNPQKDESILRGLLDAQKISSRREQDSYSPPLWKLLLKSRTVAGVALVAILLGICCFLAEPVRNESDKYSLSALQDPPSLAKLMTHASLIAAYQRGGMEMVDEISNQAMQRSGLQPDKMSLSDLYKELNND